MTVMSVYEQLVPVVWAKPPSKYSYSSLKKIEACPRQWQLLNSDWGNGQVFPVCVHPAAIEGQIVHDALKVLNRSLSLGGRPAIGTQLFQEIIDICGFWAFFDKQTTAWNKKLSENPKTGPYFVLRTPPRDLANLAIRLFRQRYRPANGKQHTKEVCRSNGNTKGSPQSPLELLQKYRILSEIRLYHPRLPLFGYLDLVTIDTNGVVKITDFKSGKPHPNHQDQLLIYGVLWWQCTGIAQQYVEVQYLNYAEKIQLSESELKKAELEIAQKIESANAAISFFPAHVITGLHCGKCSVRARCDEGWELSQGFNANTNGSLDLEIFVKEPPAQNGFIGQKTDGSDVNIVYQASLGRNFIGYTAGKKLRIVDAVSKDSYAQVEVKPWTEVFQI